MKRILGLLLAGCLCIACIPIAASAAAPEWSTAYRDFILSGRYVDAFEYESSYYPLHKPWGMFTKQVMLLDMDRDGTPELLISNGHNAQLERASYIFAYSDEQIHYIGSGPDYPIYYPGTSIPGISGDYALNGGADTHTCGYRWKEGNTIQRESVYTCDMYGNNVVQLTTNDELFRVCRAGGKRLYESGINISELENGGWEAFVNTVLPGTFPDTPAAKPSFTDIPANAFLAAPVAWAVENDITSGTSSTKFSPDAACTRAQIVTFLWRSAGSPEPSGSSNSFVDVKPSDYFYTPVLWAAENNITAGTDQTHFSPNAVCTRGQAVTFLWRAAGEPSDTLSYNPFKDVKSNDYYYRPVLWAAETGITAGTSGRTFSPANRCSRGQIVTFLYHHLVEPINVTLPLPDESLYESILDSQPGAKSVQYDVDGDGFRELLVCQETGNSIVGSMYTIRDGQVVKLLKDQQIMALASVPSGGLGVIKKDGGLYVCLRGANSGYNPPHGNNPAYTTYSGTYKLYTISDGVITLSEELDYIIRARSNAPPFQAEITATRSGTVSAKDYTSYQQWCNSFSWLAKAGNVLGKVNIYY